MDKEGLVKFLEKVDSGEVVERRTELCVECPLYGKYVPIRGTCIDLKVDEENDEVRLPTGIIGNPDSSVPYSVHKKCEYYEDVSLGGVTRILKGIACSYPENKRKENSQDTEKR